MIVRRKLVLLLQLPLLCLVVFKMGAFPLFSPSFHRLADPGMVKSSSICLSFPFVSLIFMIQ